jgi:hypothetical protein
VRAAWAVTLPPHQPDAIEQVDQSAIVGSGNLIDAAVPTAIQKGRQAAIDGGGLVARQAERGEIQRDRGAFRQTGLMRAQAR